MVIWCFHWPTITDVVNKPCNEAIKLLLRNPKWCDNVVKELKRFLVTAIQLMPGRIPSHGELVL